MKPCGCKFCNDLRYIEPASYVGYSKDASQEFEEIKIESHYTKVATFNQIIQ